MEIRFPSTKALRAFEATARLGSIKAAADYLCVTPSALSKQIQSLEEELRQPLFYRNGNGLVPTPTGEEYARRLGSIFHSLSEATLAASLDVPQTLRVLASPLSAAILVRTFKQFEELHPAAKFKLDVFPGAFGTDPAIAEADIVLNFGDGKCEGWESILLTPDAFSVPVCAPGYIRDHLSGPEQLADYTWIQVKHYHDAWSFWCEAAGCPGLQPAGVLDVNNGHLALQAAVSGLGIWVSGGTSRRPEIEELRSGALRRAYPFEAFRPGYGYHLSYPADKPLSPLVAAFRDYVINGWLGPRNTASD